MSSGNTSSRKKNWESAKKADYDVNVNLYYSNSDNEWDANNRHYLNLDDNDILDFWGEGRIEVNGMVTGFPDAYNINQQYQLVSNGIDKDRRIPNRVPAYDYDDIRTSNYIYSDSAATITLMGAPLISSVAQEMARIIKKNGKIILYGASTDYYTALKSALKKAGKNLFYYRNYPLETPLDEIKLGLPSTDYAFVPENIIIRDLSSYIQAYNYAQAFDALYSLDLAGSSMTKGIINGLINNNVTAVFNFAAYLYFNKKQSSLVTKYFPANYSKIFSGHYLNLKNVDYQTGLKLANKADGDGDRIAYGGNANSERLSWRFELVRWEGATPYFYIINQQFSSKLKLGKDTDGDGDHVAYGGGGGRFTWYLELVASGSFLLVNVDYGDYLKLSKDKDGDGDREAYGGFGGRYTWQID